MIALPLKVLLCQTLFKIICKVPLFHGHNHAILEHSRHHFLHLKVFTMLTIQAVAFFERLQFRSEALILLEIGVIIEIASYR